LVRRVLHLFLDPSIAPVTAKEEMEIISEGMTEELLEMMAQSVALPKEFIRALINGVVTVGKE
ncbi:MAG: hypothetical protein Q4A66_13250, partial [Eubacteriales bacterium]|nr:hypothetical protein [Eubacteriales bacterium]